MKDLINSLNGLMIMLIKLKSLFSSLISKHSVRNRLKQSCKEVKLMQDCKIPKESWKDFVKRIDK